MFSLGDLVLYERMDRKDVFGFGVVIQTNRTNKDGKPNFFPYRVLSLSKLGFQEIFTEQELKLYEQENKV